jgi:hypothetical protein
VGRFIKPDPVSTVGFANTSNPYVYCMNNPLRYTDKFGLNAMWRNPKVDEDNTGGSGGGHASPSDPLDMWGDMGGEDWGFSCISFVFDNATINVILADNLFREIMACLASGGSLDVSFSGLSLMQSVVVVQKMSMQQVLEQNIFSGSSGKSSVDSVVFYQKGSETLAGENMAEDLKSRGQDKVEVIRFERADEFAVMVAVCDLILNNTAVEQAGIVAHGYYQTTEDGGMTVNLGGEGMTPEFWSFQVSLISGRDDGLPVEWNIAGCYQYEYAGAWDSAMDQYPNVYPNVIPHDLPDCSLSRQRAWTWIRENMGYY